MHQAELADYVYMSIKIGSNIASIQAQRRLGEATSSLEKIYQRLSSGQRINQASDDAAGLAVSSTLSASVRVFTAAIRNVNDGISYFNVAEGTLKAASSIIMRQMELAEQSANGSYSSLQRKAMNNEANALVDEYNRIISSTSFNGIKQFTTDAPQVNIQAGIGSEAVLSMQNTIGSTVGNGTFQTALTFTANSASYNTTVLGDFNKDSIIDLIDLSNTNSGISLGNGDGTFRTRTTISTGNNHGNAYALDLNADGNLDFVAIDNSLGVISVYKGNGNGTFKTRENYTIGGSQVRFSTGDVNNDGYTDLSIFSELAGYGMLYGGADGTFGSFTANNFSGNGGATLADFNNDGNLDVYTSGPSTNVYLGNGNGSFSSAIILSIPNGATQIAINDMNGDGILDFVRQFGTNRIDINLGNGNGTFASAITSTSISGANSIKVSDMNGDGINDVVVASSTSLSVLLGQNNGYLNPAQTSTVATGGRIEIADLNNDNAIDVVRTSTSSVSFVHLALTNKTNTQARLNLLTRSDALSSLTKLQGNLTRINSEISTFGAFQSRLETAANNLSASRISYQTALSRIVDADIATESAALIQTQILQKSVASILSQANLQPQLALKLLN